MTTTLRLHPSTALSAILLGAATAMAQTPFRSDRFAPIGWLNNAPQSAANRAHAAVGGDGRGSVLYKYWIGKREVSVRDWQAFYDDPLSGKVGTFDTSFRFWITGYALGENVPAVHMTFDQMAQYCNWLTSGNATVGAYTIDQTPASPTYGKATARMAVTGMLLDGTVFYVVPSNDEWFKAAYYHGPTATYTLYAQGLDTAPPKSVDESTGWNYDGATTPSGGGLPWPVGKGSPEQNGTLGMMGNCWERCGDAAGTTRLRGSSYSAGNPLEWLASESSLNAGANHDVTFRVAAIGLPLLRYPAGGGAVPYRHPTFTWEDADGATWYQLWITRNGQTYLTPWSEGRPSWTPPARLPAGTYRWWVRSWRAAGGYGAWSTAADFTIPVGQPGLLALEAPDGPQGDHQPTYRWLQDASATWYRLWVGRVGAGTWIDRWYNLTGDDEAAVTPGGAHPGASKPLQTGPVGALAFNQPTFAWQGGLCEWWLRGWGPDGYGPWAGPMRFSIPQSPTDWYHVYVARGGVKVIDQWVQGNSLAAPAPLAAGAYAWWVASWDSTARRELWSDRMDFTVP